MRFVLCVLAWATLEVAQPTPVIAQKSALDGHQFDGVSSDAELKVEGHTGRYWLSRHPVEARDYWAAWDCKGKPCDSKWYANIRTKARLVQRTDTDPRPLNGTTGRRVPGGG
jgi:hypothetical protein